MSLARAVLGVYLATRERHRCEPPCWWQKDHMWKCVCRRIWICDDRRTPKNARSTGDITGCRVWRHATRDERAAYAEL